MAGADIGYEDVSWRLAVYGDHWTLPRAYAQAECRQSGATYFGIAAVGAIRDAMSMRLERPVTDA